MLTLFTTPKPFSGHSGIIQRNAIRSWTLLSPRPEILIVEEVEGAGEVARELGCTLVGEVKRNELGTPLLSDIFAIGQRDTANDLVCYVNADIILTQSFVDGVRRVAELKSGEPFLLVGRRWNVYLSKPWDFDHDDWEERLWEYARNNGYQESPGATDYFAFPRGTFTDIPDFAVGRGAWDGWFLWNARHRHVPLIDATSAIRIYHQQHDYCHLKSGKNNLTDRECRANQRLRGTFLRQFNILDSNYLLAAEGVQASSTFRVIPAGLLRAKMCVIYYLQRFHPWSYPLVVALKGVNRLAKSSLRLVR